MQQRTKIAIAVAVAMQAMTGYAQDQAQPALQRVEVTGSRIRQVDLETAQPIQVVTQEQIQKTGLVTVGDIINNLSSAGSPDFSKGGALTSNRESGGQYANLRNLGSNRLLVLVDGKRWTQTVNGYTDMSTIPASMIDRIEVLKDGASSIYGSDAIAGVVNIILKKSMEGGQVSLYEGANQHHGDGKSKDFSISYGANNDQGSLLFGLTHTEQGPVWAASRDITSATYGPDLISSSTLGTGPWGRIRQVSGTGGPTGFNQYLNHTGGYDGSGTGSASNVLGNYHTPGTINDLFNSTQQMMFQMPTKLDSIFTKGSLELPYGMHFASTAMFAQRNASTQVAGYPLNSLSQPTYPVYVDANSYYNPDPGQNLFFYRRTIELPRVTNNENRTLHIDATLSGDFNALGRSFNWDIGYNHSAETGSTLSTGNLNLINLKKALGPSFMNSAGQVQCGTAAAPIALSQCVPFDILGGPSASTAAALAYVNETGQGSYGSTVNSATANIAGDLMDLPAGALGFAAGLENRSVGGYDRPGQMEQSGYSTDLGANTTVGHYDIKEEYLELNVPVLKNQPFAKSLSFDLATRHSDYSNFGTTNNSKISFQWKPVSDLLVRGTWAQGFRAPTVGDTFGGGQQTFDTYLDPCDSKFGQASKDAAVAARCAAAGVPAGFRQLGQTGVAISGSGGSQTPFPFYSGAGNTTLTPETAVTDTLGFVYSPSFLPGFSGSVDWYRIKINNMISAVSATWVANQCYLQGNPTFCNAIQRDASGQISTLSRGNLNLGAMQTDGADISLGYRFPMTRYGRFALHSDTSYVHSFKQQASSGAEWIDYVGEYYYNKFKSVNTLDWSFGNWSATWTARYYSPVKDQCWDTDVMCNMPGASASWGTDVNKLGAEVYHDLNVGYKTPWKGQIQAGINNLFGKQPRISFNGAASSSAVDADMPLDRFFYVRYNQSF